MITHEQQLDRAREAARIGVTHLRQLNGDPSFQWFMRECVGAMAKEAGESAISVTGTDQECRDARMRYDALAGPDGVAHWLNRKLNELTAIADEEKSSNLQD